MELIKKNQYKTTEWSGGTTTELLIYPSTSEYNERNFKWRISSAKVDAEESIFTNLPGISRCLMLIDGKMTLKHEGKYTIELKPFEQDNFMGDWTTKSLGKARDFNLMMADGYTGSLEALTIKAGEQIHISFKKNNEKQITDIFYVVDGSLELAFNNNKFIINENDLFYKTNSCNEKEYPFSLFNKSAKEVKIIRALVCC